LLAPMKEGPAFLSLADFEEIAGGTPALLEIQP
jgi:hypothetical protein